MVIIGFLLMCGGFVLWFVPFIGILGFLGLALGLILFVVGFVIPSERRQEPIVV